MAGGPSGATTRACGRNSASIGASPIKILAVGADTVQQNHQLGAAGGRRWGRAGADQLCHVVLCLWYSGPCNSALRARS